MEPELIKRVNEATRQALARDEVKSRLVELGYDLWVGSPGLVTERATRELALWGSVTKGIKFD
jgi:tripartite-type tricarboxylate transporter receptor subunit TctC